MANEPLSIQHPEISWLHTEERVIAAYNNVTLKPSKPVSFLLEFSAFQGEMSCSFISIMDVLAVQYGVRTIPPSMLSFNWFQRDGHMPRNQHQITAAKHPRPQKAS